MECVKTRLKIDPKFLQDNQNFVARVHAAPINPLDLIKMEGALIGAKLPLTPGSECSGVIVSSKNNSLIGKKVSILGEQMWSQYVTGSTSNAIIHQDEVDLDQAACGFVNPLTCLGLISQAEKYKAKAIINLAANSALGQYIHRVSIKKGIQSINVVRSREKMINLKDQLNGYQHVLNSQSDSFFQDIEKLSSTLGATILFDPIGGNFSGKVLNYMPKNSVLINYGSLSGNYLNEINTIQLRWANKKIEGFALFHYWKGLLDNDKQTLQNFVRDNYKDLFQTKIQGQYSFENVKDALTQYTKNMSAGKVLLKPIIRN